MENMKMNDLNYICFDFDSNFRKDDFYKFFNEIVTFNKNIEVRIFDLTGKYNPFSKYATNVNELLKIMKHYNNRHWLLYYGINTRQNMTRINKQISKRRLFYFDIEDSGEKPPLTNEVYRRQLSMTVDFINKYLYTRYKIKPCSIMISGRGLHLYYNFKPIDNIKYKNHFKLWYKGLQEEMNKIKPFKNIKFSDSVFDGSRIASLPGSYNFNKKYDEKPFRNILFVENNEFDLLPMMKEVELKVKRIERSKVRKVINTPHYTDENIRNSPEYVLLSYSNLPIGEIHTHLNFSFKLLCRDNNITIIEDLIEELKECGRETLTDDIPDNEYNYNRNIINNWCIDNYEWCVDNDFKLPYSFNKGIIKPYFKLEGEVNFPETKIESVDEMISYIREFNRNSILEENDYIKIYYNSLINKLEKSCNKKLLKFVKDNGILNKIILVK